MSRRPALAALVVVSLALPAPGPAHGPAHGPPQVKAAEAARRYRLRVEADPPRPVAGKEARISVYLLDAAGKPLKGLEVHHERLAHFLLVDANLEDFQHLHAEDFGLLTEEARAEGRFTFPATFRHGGRHLVAVDFVQQGKAVHSALELDVEGPPPPPTAWRLTPVRQAGEVEGRLFLTPDRPEAGSYAEAVVSLSAGGAPLADLKPYLGADAHVAVFGEGARSSAHVHGEKGTGHGGGGHGAGEPAPGGGVSKIAFGYAFPEPGRYRVFVQFARTGGVVTLPFDVEAVEPSAGGH